jgi:hypothetical protein
MVTVFTHAFGVEGSVEMGAFCDLTLRNFHATALFGLLGLLLRTRLTCLPHRLLLLGPASLCLSNRGRRVAEVVAGLAEAFAFLLHVLIVVPIKGIIINDFLGLLFSRTLKCPTAAATMDRVIAHGPGVVAGVLILGQVGPGADRSLLNENRCDVVERRSGCLDDASTSYGVIFVSFGISRIYDGLQIDILADHGD